MPFMQTAVTDPEVVSAAGVGGVLVFTFAVIRMLLAELKDERDVRRIEAEVRIHEARAALETARTLAMQHEHLKELLRA